MQQKGPDTVKTCHGKRDSESPVNDASVKKHIPGRRKKGVKGKEKDDVSDDK